MAAAHEKPRRKPLETKDRQLQRYKESYEKMNNTSCSPDQIRKFEKHLEREILPRVYESKER